ncbi:Type II secretory pathway, pullulanase PulA [Rhodobacteraceae bacterium 63075]|nr:Type II secretory pathway, pullulanase PulA [Rhodobacteraceae bacterium 63075]
MIISRGRRYIFVHIPKTGGTAMALALEARAMKDDMMLGDTPKALKRRRRLKDADAHGRLWKHSTLADIEGLVSRAEIAGSLCFTLVRNPWDRMVSYYHWLGQQGFAHPAVDAAKTLGFSEFLRAPAVAGPIKANPAAAYMRDVDGGQHAALYIRLEHFAEDAAPLWEHLGFELELPRANESDRREDFRSYYSAADRAAVAEICRADIDRFGYSFG